MNEPLHNAANDRESTKRLTVREAVEEPMRRVCVATADQSIADVAECFSENPGVNTLPVIDSDGRLVGIIPMRLLFDDLFLRIAPEEFLETLEETKGLEEFGRMTRAGTAGALMEPPAFVTLDDSIRDAFALMHERQLAGLPIVNSEMEVTGYLDRLHLVQTWLKHYGGNG